MTGEFRQRMCHLMISVVNPFFQKLKPRLSGLFCSMKNLIYLLSVLVLCSSCSTEKEMRANGYTQGTTYSIVYYNDGQNLQYQIDSLLLDFDRVLSTYQENSYISKWNRNEVDGNQPEFFTEVVSTAIEVNDETKGAFDITISPLMDYWFSQDWNTTEIDSTTVDSLMNAIGTSKIIYEDGFYTNPSQSLTLDVNAIAQGYSVDVVASYLESNGIFNYLVEIGGEVRAAGFKSGEKSWNVGIDKPSADANQRDLIMSIPLDNKSLATSGNYRKFVEVNGQKLGHSLNPKTGYPATTDVLSASVIANDCITADAWATACLVLGFSESKKLISNRSGLDAIMIYSGDDGTVSVWDSRNE